MAWGRRLFNRAFVRFFLSRLEACAMILLVLKFWQLSESVLKHKCPGDEMEDFSQYKDVRNLDVGDKAFVSMDVIDTRDINGRTGIVVGRGWLALSFSIKIDGKTYEYIPFGQVGSLQPRVTCDHTLPVGYGPDRGDVFCQACGKLIRGTN